MKRRQQIKGTILKKTDDGYSEDDKPSINQGTLVSKIDIDFMKQGFGYYDI